MQTSGNKGMDPTVFGPGTWGILYTAAYACARGGDGGAASHDGLCLHRAVQLLVEALGVCMGCDPCRLTYLAYIEAHPVLDAIWGRALPPAAGPLTPADTACLASPGLRMAWWVYGLQCRVAAKLGRPQTLSFAQTVRRLVVYRGGLGSAYDVMSVLEMFGTRACCANRFRSTKAVGVLLLARAIAALAAWVPKWGAPFRAAVRGSLDTLAHMLLPRDDGGGAAAVWTPVLCLATLLDARERLCASQATPDAAAAAASGDATAEGALACSLVARGRLGTRVRDLVQLPRLHDAALGTEQTDAVL